MVYREIKLPESKLSDGKTGNKIIKLVGAIKDKDARKKLADEMSVTEEKGEAMGTPTEVLAVPIDTFEDYNYRIQIVKKSAYEKSQSIEEAKRMEYANWRLSLAQVVPLDAEALIAWVDETYDIEEGQFKPKQTPQQGQQNQAIQNMQNDGQQPENPQSKPAQNNAPLGGRALSNVARQ